MLLYFPCMLYKYGIIFMYYLNRVLYCKKKTHISFNSVKVLYDEIN